MDIARILDETGCSVTYAEVVYPPGSTYGPVQQPTVELGFVHRGTMAVSLGRERLEVLAGNACLLLPGDRAHFVFSPTAETDHSWVHFWSVNGYPQQVIERLARLPRTIRLSSTLAREMRELLDLGASRLPSRREIELLLAHRMLYQYVGEAELAGGLGVVYTGPVERALEHVDKHLASQVDLDGLAEAAMVSKPHLIRLFHEQLGTTPARYLWYRRVQRGVELLQETGLAVDEIARRCGFRTSHHFSRRVRQLTGLTPTALRDRARARSAPEAVSIEDARGDSTS